jgi:DNA-binding transcriptional ArsR family regulator
VTEVAEMLGITVVNASHHLTVLRHAKLVRSQRQGRFMLYSLPPSVFRPETEVPGEMQQINLGCCRIEIPRREG